MVVVPGNLSDAEKTCGLCHLEEVNAVNNSIMATNSGIVNVDRFIFGEVQSPDDYAHIQDIVHSAADEHLRNLCGFCHLGNEKKVTGPINELSRGGGCNACHLNYSRKALADHIEYKEDSILPKAHPTLDLTITDEHCFGCHSRSGRISTGYEGFHETLLSKDDISDENNKYRVLMDDRVFEYLGEDVHHDRGMNCIDCHGYYDLMGDGTQYMHAADAVKIKCEDCHGDEQRPTGTFDSLNFIQQRIYASRNYSHTDFPMLQTEKGNHALLNTYIDENGSARMVGKNTGKVYDLLPPSQNCTGENGHESLTCSSCHTSWTPQCIGCHVNFDKDVPGYDLLEGRESRGSWIEYVGEFNAGESTLGVKENDSIRQIRNAIPGMIMTLDIESYRKPLEESDTSFFRLFAPAEPHTISATGRSCKSCHNDPVALGYGRGSLSFSETSKRWSFNSEYSHSGDGLPADAWTGFLEERKGLVSTKTGFRPFTVEEQKKILTVGACLTCHEGTSEVMTRSLTMDFSEYLNEVHTSCTTPIFNEKIPD
jgi:hypothetical protein